MRHWTVTRKFNDFSMQLRTHSIYDICRLISIVKNALDIFIAILWLCKLNGFATYVQHCSPHSGREHSFSQIANRHPIQMTRIYRNGHHSRQLFAFYYHRVKYINLSIVCACACRMATVSPLGRVISKKMQRMHVFDVSIRLDVTRHRNIIQSRRRFVYVIYCGQFCVSNHH